jgi:FecR protein
MVIRKIFSPLFLIAAFSLAAVALAPSPAAADVSHARIIRLSYVQGDVRFTRDAHGDPLTDGENLWETAVLNLPIRQGYVLATDHGRATVEFENGALAFLNENTVIEFYDLSLDEGAHTTRLVIRQGSASFYVNPSNGDYFSVTGGDFTAEATTRASFRLNNFDDASNVNVLAGHVDVVRKDKTTALAKGQSLSMIAGDVNAVNVGSVPEADEFDRWVSGSVSSTVAATKAGAQYSNSASYVSGFGDLYTYGSWFPVNGYGYGWRPFGVGLGWSPFDNGGWFQDSAFGWGFIGNQPWGWLPFHYGGWLFQSGLGWIWAPGNFTNGGLNGWRPVTGTWVHTKTGTVGIVPVHPADVHGKTPNNLQQAVFPVSRGTISNVPVANSTEQWKVEKSPARDTLTSSLAATTRPERVSSISPSGGSSNRVAFDAGGHRFVTPGASASAASSTRVQSSEMGKPATSNTAAMSAAVRNSAAAAPRRPIAPAPSSSERAAGGSTTWVGGGRSSGSTSSAHPSNSTTSTSSSHPSGGRPH